MKYCFGVDIGGTTVKLGLFSEAGAIVEKWEIVTRTENEGAAILPDVAEAINGKLEQHGIEKEQVLGIGVGVPAPVTVDGIVNGSANLGWKYKNAKKELEELTGLTAEFGNDANVAALGEMWKGGGWLPQYDHGHTWNRCWWWHYHQWKDPDGRERSRWRDWSYVCESGRDRYLRMWRTRMSGAVCISNRYLSSCKKEDGA